MNGAHQFKNIVIMSEEYMVIMMEMVVAEEAVDDTLFMIYL